MNNKFIRKSKKDILSLGRLLWDKGLVAGWNGNISVRVEGVGALVTGRGTCLGTLREKDIVLVGFDGGPIGKGAPSSETRLHVDIYKNRSDVQAIVHTHTVFTNAFFLEHDVFRSATLEGAYLLGDVFSVDQKAINVSDTAPVLRRLKAGKLVVLKRHGVVSVGASLFDCFARIQVLEEQVKTEAVRRLFRNRSVNRKKA